MYLSHSKLSCILSCPMTYFLQYRMGIRPKQQKMAFSCGSAVHWGLENNTDDLTAWYEENGSLYQKKHISEEQILAEAMVHGFLKNKEQIFDEILRHPITGEKLTLVKEIHELKVYGKLKSFKYDEPHTFVGIIDLLLIVSDRAGNLYAIIIDYKTSSYQPNWSDYMDQIYRYIFLLDSIIPEIPVLKTGIINLRKGKIKQKETETIDEFRFRCKLDYEISDGTYIAWHMYDTDMLDKKAVTSYIENLSREADLAECIDLNNMWFINFGAANGKYKSEYLDIFNQTPNCYVLYDISDVLYDADNDVMLDVRSCRPLDMKVIEPFANVLNKYEQFKAQALAYYSINNDIEKEAFFKKLSEQFTTDRELLELYWNTLLHELATQSDDTTTATTD